MLPANQQHLVLSVTMCVEFFPTHPHPTCKENQALGLPLCFHPPQGRGENLHLSGRPHLSYASTTTCSQIWQGNSENTNRFWTPPSLLCCYFWHQFYLDRKTKRSLHLLHRGKFLLISAKGGLIPYKRNLFLYKCTWTCCCLLQWGKTPITGDLQDFLKAQQTFSLLLKFVQ